jgi:hypothetical protein
VVDKADAVVVEVSGEDERALGLVEQLAKAIEPKRVMATTINPFSAMALPISIRQPIFRRSTTTGSPCERNRWA